MILSFAGMTMILVVLHLAPIAAAAASLIAPIATTLAATTTTTTNTVMRGNCCVWSCWKC